MKTYDKQLVLSYAEEITQGIGLTKLYTDVNPHYKNAPYNFHLGDYYALGEFVIRHFEELGVKKSIHVVRRSEVNHINGLYLNMGANIYIMINDKMNLCWTRFTIISELCATYVDHYQNEIIENTIYQENEDIIQGIEDTIAHQLKFANRDGLRDGDLDKTTFAMLLAMELMIPRHYRYITDEYLSKVKEGSMQLYDVATSLLIPEFILKLYVENQ
ncbi:hypothetical protein [Mucilaginibacter sp. HD30]